MPPPAPAMHAQAEQAEDADYDVLPQSVIRTSANPPKAASPAPPQSPPRGARASSTGGAARPMSGTYNRPPSGVWRRGGGVWYRYLSGFPLLHLCALMDGTLCHHLRSE